MALIDSFSSQKRRNLAVSDYLKHCSESKCEHLPFLKHQVGIVLLTNRYLIGLCYKTISLRQIVFSLTQHRYLVIPLLLQDGYLVPTTEQLEALNIYQGKMGTNLLTGRVLTIIVFYSRKVDNRFSLPVEGLFFVLAGYH